MPQFEASFTVINYTPRLINYAPKEHLYFRHHGVHHMMFIIQATDTSCV